MKGPTPAPWRIVGTNNGLFVAGSKPGYFAELRDCGSGDVAANASLIAAAPDMLAALRQAVTTLEYAANALQAPERSSFREDIAAARAAIAKAIQE